MNGINNENWTNKSLKEAIELGIAKAKYAMHTSLPAVVKSYDYSTQKAVVVPLIRRKIVNLEEEESLPSIPSVPVGHVNSNGGKTFIHTPIKVGDLGWLHFSESSLKEYLSLSTNKVVNSKSFRRFNLVDAIFEPKVRPFNNSLNPSNNDDLIIEHDNISIFMNDKGTIRIENSTGSELLTATYDFMTATIDLADEYTSLLTAMSTFMAVLAADTVILPATRAAAGTFSTYLTSTAITNMLPIIIDLNSAQAELGDLKT